MKAYCYKCGSANPYGSSKCNKCNSAFAHTSYKPVGKTIRQNIEDISQEVALENEVALASKIKGTRLIRKLLKSPAIDFSLDE